MNQYSKIKNQNLHTFVTNLHDLYIELLMTDAIKSAKKAQLIEKIDQALLAHNEVDFMRYTDELKALEA